jgi:predicted HicB family RNase H-like nuclease
MTEKRKPGRPPLAEADRTEPVTIRMPARDFANAATRARDERITLAEWIRRALRSATDRDPPK